MAGFSFGKGTTPRKFDYIPRYYDPQKEELKERLAQYKDEKDQEGMKDRIRSGMRQKYNADSGYRSSQVKKSNLRLLYIIIILIFCSYLILRSDAFFKLIDSFS